MSDKNVLLRHVTASRDTGEKDALGGAVVETLHLVPGDDVPDWARKEMDDSFFGDPEEGLPVDNSVRDAAFRQAENEGVPVDEAWTTDQVAQAVRVNREAALTGRKVDWDEFTDAFGQDEQQKLSVEPAMVPVTSSGSEAVATTAGSSQEQDVEALTAEYRELSDGQEPDGRWRPNTLARKVEELRAEKASGGAHS